MSERQPFGKGDHAKRSRRIQSKVNALSEAQVLDKAYGILDATDRKDLGKKNAKVLRDFGKRAEAILSLPEALDTLYEEKIGVPIFVADKESDAVSLIATSLKIPDEEFAQLIVLSNRRFAVIDLGDESELFNYKNAFNPKNGEITLPAELEILDDEGKLLDEYTGDFFETLSQAGARVKINDEDAEGVDAMIPYIEKAIEGIVQVWTEHSENVVGESNITDEGQQAA